VEKSKLETINELEMEKAMFTSRVKSDELWAEIPQPSFPAILIAQIKFD